MVDAIVATGANIVDQDFFEGQQLPASYANFLLTNYCVLVPVFNDPNARVVLNIMSELFPKKVVTGIYCGDFVWGYGTIHCATQQEIASLA